MKFYNFPEFKLGLKLAAGGWGYTAFSFAVAQLGFPYNLFGVLSIYAIIAGFAGLIIMMESQHPSWMNGRG